MQDNIGLIKRLPRFQKFEEVVMISDRCQVCLSKTDFEFKNEAPTDRLVKCTLCLSCIHQTHYGGELVQEVPAEWFCERCEYLLSNQQGVVTVDCQFCTTKQGIMKRIQIDKIRVWSHLQCITWDYPLRVFTCTDLKVAKRFFKSQTPFEKFWSPEFSQQSCHYCHSSYGQFIRCRYYSCGKHFHVPCARKIGVIRELEKMRVQNTETYIPVLCPEHLKARGPDFRAKSHEFHDRERSREAINLAKIYDKQHADMVKAAKEETKVSEHHFVYGQTVNQGQMSEQSLSSQTQIREQSVYSEQFLKQMEVEIEIEDSIGQC